MARVWPLAAALVLIGLVLLAYRDAPGNGFQFDDYDNIVEHAPVHARALSVEALWRAATESFLPRRPLPSASFALDWWRGGGDPRPFQWTNLVLHALNAVLVLALAHLLLGRVAQGWPRRLAALGAAALWACHPIQVQAVTYIVQRMTLMAAGFTLLAVVVYLLGRRPGASRGWLLLSALAMLLGVLSKENAVVAPVLVALAELGVRRHAEPLWRRRFEPWAAALPVVAGLYVLGDALSGAGPLGRWLEGLYAARDFSLVERLLTQPRVIFFHLSQVLYPEPGRFSIEHDFAVSTGLLSPPATAAAFAGLALWLGAGLWLLARPRRRVLGFCLLWPLAALAVESSVLPLEMVFEHRMYLPLAGPACLAGIGLAWMLVRGGALAGGAGLATVAITALLVSATQARVPDWRTKLSLYRSAVEHAPRSPRAWSNLGWYYLEAGRTGEAERAARRALALDGGASLALETLGVIRLGAGDPAGAEALLGRALSLEAGYAGHTLFNHLGEARLALGQAGSASDLFRRASERAPWVPAYRWNAALALERLGECRQARAQWERFLELSDDAAERAAVRAHLAERHDAPAGACAPGD